MNCTSVNDDEVQFEFIQTGDKRKLFVHKKVLINASPVFQTMFDEKWTTSLIKMADDVSFDQYQTFMLFIECLVNQMVSNLSIQEACNLYYYAHKYDVQVMETNICNQISTILEAATVTQNDYCQELTLSDLAHCVKCFNLYSLEKLRMQLEQVELEINSENVLEFYEIITSFKLYSLLHRQVMPILMSPMNPSLWPIEVMKQIIECFRHYNLIRIKLIFIFPTNKIPCPGSESIFIKVDPLNRISFLFKTIEKYKRLTRNQVILFDKNTCLLDTSLNKTLEDFGIHDNDCIEVYMHSVIL